MRVTIAAIRTKDGKVWSVPRPGRHGDVIRKIYEATGEAVADETQGFLLSDGRFVDRADAEDVARESGQVTGDLIGGVLTSEDLWDSRWCRECDHTFELLPHNAHLTHCPACGHAYPTSA